jgi:uncharacterized protein YbaP (TraB family)
MLPALQTKAKHSQQRLLIAAVFVPLILPSLAAEPRACLWRVQSDTTTAYLQGSIHLLSEDAYPLPEPIENAFKASEQIVLEMDLAIMTDPDAQVEMMVKGMLPRGESLTDILSPETLKLAEKCSTEVGLQMMAFKHYRPWMFVMVLTATRLEQLGFSAHHGIDWHFYQRARKLKKPVIGLETLDEQLALFESMVAGDRDAFVRQSLEDFATIEEELTDIIASWRNGDLAGLEKALLDNLRNYPSVHRILIKERNAHWMKTLDKVLQSGTTSMIIVGAGHLPGEDGLVSLLRARGYTVEQL